MTPKQETFAAGIAQGLTQADAYRQAYPNAGSWRDAAVWPAASRLASTAMVLARVAELGAKAAAANEVTVTRIVREMARIGFFDIRKLMDADGRPIPLHLLSDEAAACISGVEICTVGNAEMGVGEVVKFKIADKTKNLENLMRHLGGFEKDNAQSKAQVVLTGFRMVAS